MNKRLILFVIALIACIGCARQEQIPADTPAAAPEPAAPVEEEAVVVESAPEPAAAPVAPAPAPEPEPVAAEPAIPPLHFINLAEGDRGAFVDGELIDAPDGNGKVIKANPKQWINGKAEKGLPADWNAYDALVLEVINPGTESFRLGVTIFDTMNRGYWSRHNRYVGLSPGNNTIRIPLNDMWRGEVLRHDIEGFIDTGNIVQVAMNGAAEWMLADIRLIITPREDTGISLLKAYDVGKAGSPVLAGFEALTEKDTYTAEKGFGWTKTDFARKDDRIHPDDLYRDNLSCRNAVLAIDLPNDNYTVHMQLEDPGYWEYMQNYRSRKVSAEGTEYINESVSYQDFMDKYFRNQDAEDLPDEDPFEKYVETRHPWHTFETVVKDGQLNIALRSESNYGNTLSALIVYPSAEADKGAAYLASVKEKRRASWAQRWKPVAPPLKQPQLSGTLKAEADINGFVLFDWPAELERGYNYVPAENEKITSLQATLCRNEYEPISFGMKPVKALGKVELSVSDLQGPEGAVIPSSSIQVRVGRYRFIRHQGHQSGMYTIGEKELRRFNTSPENELNCTTVMTRHFWLTVPPQTGKAAGTYTGNVSLTSERGGTVQLPLSVTVLPAELPEPDFLFSLYGIMLQPSPYYDELKATVPQRKEAMYRDLRAHGINYIKDSGARITWENGKAVITNMEAMRSEFALRKKLGFVEGPVGAGSRSGMNELATAETIKGQPRQEYIRNWFGEITDVFKAEGWPHPTFCFGDEPGVPETLVALTTAHNNLHAVSPDIWTNIAYHISNQESRDMMPSLNVHHFKRFCAVEDFKAASEMGQYVIASNIGPTRRAFGLWSWRAKDERGLDGSITFSYTGSHVDIYYDLDAREGDYAMAPPRKDGSYETRMDYECIREGIDDFRYAQLLDGIVKQGGAKAAAAKALLDQGYALGEGPRKEDKAKVHELRAWRSKVQDLIKQ